ncbi:MAG: flagellar biosynthetic protein FliO, partial [Myxococcales bacterium]
LPAIAGSKIQVGSVVKITPKTQLAIVTVNGRSMLLGTTDVAVTRLMWLDENETDDIHSDDADSPLVPGERIDPNEMFSTASPMGVVQRAALKTPQSATPAWKTGNAKSGSKFREILSDVIGGTAPDKSRGISPAEVLAATTVDRYQSREERHGATPVRKHVANTVMVDCEGQAAGLIARLNRTQS